MARFDRELGNGHVDNVVMHSVETGELPDPEKVA